MIDVNSDFEKIFLYVDGGSRENPGKAAIAYLIKHNNRFIKSGGKYIGICTNNVAEYEAVGYGLEAALPVTKKCICCISDSNLVVNQLNGKWKINSPHLKRLHDKTKDLVKLFDNVEFTYHPREDPNLLKVDRMVNEILDNE